MIKKQETMKIDEIFDTSELDKKLNGIEQLILAEGVKSASKILVLTMEVLEIPNFIETEFGTDDKLFRLRIERVKPEEEKPHEDEIVNAENVEMGQSTII